MNLLATKPVEDQNTSYYALNVAYNFQPVLTTLYQEHSGLFASEIVALAMLAHKLTFKTISLNTRLQYMDALKVIIETYKGNVFPDHKYAVELYQELTCNLVFDLNGHQGALPFSDKFLMLAKETNWYNHMEEGWRVENLTFITI